MIKPFNYLAVLGNRASKILGTFVFSAFLFSEMLHADEFQRESDTIIFSYWDQATPPFVFTDGDLLVTGIIKDIGDAIADSLDLKVSYSKLPVARVEPFLRSGKTDADCVTSPIWKDHPDDYVWSKPLFEGADRFLVRNDGSAVIKSFEELKGLRVGIYNGYVYHPDIMKMIESKEFTPMKVKDLEKGITLLKLKRIDTLIDFGILLRYQLLKLNLQDELVLAEAYADQFELSCAFSPKSPIGTEKLNDAVDKLTASGKIKAILEKYR